MEKLLPNVAANSMGSAVAAERYRPYPAYRDSGVEWLGDIPEHWDVKRLKEFATVQLSNVDKKTADDEDAVQLCNYVDVYYNHKIGRRIEFMAATATPSQIRRFSLRTGDVLITKDSETWTDIAVPAVVMEDLPGVLCGYHLAHIRPHEKHDGFFLAHCIAAVGPRDQYHVAANGITRFGLTGDAIRNGTLAIPPLVEQRRIAAFLDFETEKVDALVAQKERLIELLREKRTALITCAVTKGICSDAPMKDSGVEWLGEIPSHWDIRQLNRVIEKFVDYRGKTPEKIPFGVPLVTARNIKNQMIDFSVSKEFISEELYPKWMVRGLPEPGDVIVTTEAPLGECAQINGMKIALAQRIILLKAMQDKISNDYLKYHFVSDFGQHELQTRSTGSTALGVKASHLKVSLIVVPPIEEQVQIATLLDRETARIDVLVSKIREAIDRLKELRITLIAAAVTGKVDVRKALP